MGRTAKKGIWAYTADGFAAVRLLDNGNIYGVMLSEMVSNIFKEGMWFKALTPYMLILTNNDPVQVGNMLTLNGLTRAFTGVVSGRMMINALGVEAVWVVTGFVGLLAILINVVCLCKGSVPAAYFLNFAWAIYNGLWNSCLETSWAKSIVRSKREDVNGARQITNKVTTSLGPLFSAAIFLYCGNKWDIELVQQVMLFGTMMTTFTVLLCFCFRTSQEVEQDLALRSVERFLFPDASSPGGWKEFRCSELTHHHFQKEEAGCVRLTYPIGVEGDGDSRLRIVTRDFKETPFILAQQYRAAFKGIPVDHRFCVLCFEDVSRAPERVIIKEIEIFLTQERTRSVNRTYSAVHFSLSPRSDAEYASTPGGLAILSTLICGRLGWRKESQQDSLKEALLRTQPEEGLSPNRQDGSTTTKAKKKDEAKTNMTGANVIVVCDVLNALGAGFSLKFMDLFLKVDYGVSPAGIFMVAFFQNIFAAWLTPYAKRLLATMRERGYRPKLGVVFLWSLALGFLGLLIVPDMPLWVVLPSIVMMQSLNSCTRAYNRAQLINYLPREKVANYMTWDALNKANQGGVAIFGAQVVEIGGYRGCFAGTFLILLLRLLVYLAYTLRKGPSKRAASASAEGEVAPILVRQRSAEEDVTAEEMNEKENIRGFDGDLESQMFQDSEALAVAMEQQDEEEHAEEGVQGLNMLSFLSQLPPSSPVGSPSRRGRTPLAGQ